MELSEASKKQIEIEVLDSFKGLVEASKVLSTQQYFEYFDSEKFVGLNSNGTNWNSIDDLKKVIEPGFNAIDKIESLEFTNVRVSVIDSNTAILVNEYKQVLLLKKGTRFKVAGGGTQVWSKLSGVWKLVSVSASTNQLK